VARDESQKQPVEQRRRIAIQRGQSGRVERSSTPEAGQFGEERLSRADEPGNGFGQARVGGCQAPGLIIDHGPRVSFQSFSSRPIAGIGIEIVDERRDESSTIAAVRLALEVVEVGGSTR
jgi:hypothetical protein